MATNYVVLVDGSCIYYGAVSSVKENGVIHFFKLKNLISIIFSLDSEYYSEYIDNNWVDKNFEDYRGNCLLYALASKSILHFFYR